MRYSYTPSEPKREDTPPWKVAVPLGFFVISCLSNPPWWFAAGILALESPWFLYLMYF